ncbi:MAG: hypothetical protein H6971_03515 [Gammaproteobacteria bacterium]|nr:hypothetical protein [Gammaproteobacteria bacterium]
MKRFVLSASVIFMFALIWNVIVHMVILREANEALSALARPGPDRSIVLSLLQTAGLSAIFVLSYVWSRHAGTLKGGLAHGALFGVLAGLLVDLNQYILYPIPASLAAAWFAFGFAEFCIYGMIAALVYRQDTQPCNPPDLAQKAAQGR